MRNICIVAGARPNFIKVAPIVKAIEHAKTEGRQVDYKLVYTGIADDDSVEDTLFDDLGISSPDVFLGVTSESLNELTGQVMSAFDRFLNETPTDIVIVVDDLASTMAVAIVTKKRGIKLVHLVAGTRSFDINMPKEVNRLVIDGLSDLLFTAGAGANSIVAREGADISHIYMVGNILMDTLRYNHDRFRMPSLFQENGITDGNYIVLTINRKVLIADKEKIRNIIAALLDATSNVKDSIKIVAPLRGKARDVVAEMLPRYSNILLTSPMSYLEFGYLTMKAKGIVTDSGNVAEEATFNGVPCVTLNSYTEHVETTSIGSNVLVGDDIYKLKAALNDIVDGRWKKCALPDRWDGRTAERILKILLD